MVDMHSKGASINVYFEAVIYYLLNDDFKEL